MKKLLLLFVVSALMITSAVAQTNFSHRLVNKDFSLKMQNKELKRTTLKSQSIIHKSQSVLVNNKIQKAKTSSDILMSWDFEEITADNDWYIFDFDGLITTWWGDAEGWVLDAETPTNTALVSQSWFETPGQADDWVISDAFTVPNDGATYEASWDAKAQEAAPYNDGYQFRVVEDAAFTTFNAALTDATPLATASANLQVISPILYTCPGENPEWTTRRVSLDTYKGKTIRLIWRNNSDDKDALWLDNVAAYKKADFASNIRITHSPIVPYTFVPQFLASTYTDTISVKIDNNGSLALLGVSATFKGYKNSNVDLVDAVSVGGMAVASSKTLTSKAGYNIVAAKPANSYYYSVEVAATQDAGSYVETANLTGPELSTDSIFARDNGIMGSYTSVNSTSTSNTKKIGIYYEIKAKTKLHSVSFDIYNCTAPTTIVRIFKTTDFVTFAQVAASSSITLTTGVASETFYKAQFDNLTLLPGSYVVTLDEPASKSIGVVITENNSGENLLYFDGTNWGSDNSTLAIRLKVSDFETALNHTYLNNLNVYYANQSIVVKGLKAETNVSIYTMTGQQILSTKLMNGNTTIPTVLSKGIYLVKVENSSYKVTVK